MSTPAVIFLCLTAVSLTAKLALHGREYKVNFWLGCLEAELALGVLHAGGFFS